MLCCSRVFPSVRSRGSADSVSDCPGFFAGLFATVEGSDFSGSFFVRFDSSSPPMRTALKHLERPSRRSPGFRPKSVSACQDLRPRGVEQALAFTCLHASPFATLTVLAETIAIRKVVYQSEV